jgi:hypothetical protein
MDEFPHCRLIASPPTMSVEAPMFAPTYVPLLEGEDVLVVAAPGIAVATSEMESGAKLLTIFLYSPPYDDDPQDEAVGMGHNMTVETARGIAANITKLCDEAEAAADALATAAIEKARGR